MTKTVGAVFSPLGALLGHPRITVPSPAATTEAEMKQRDRALLANFEDGDRGYSGKLGPDTVPKTAASVSTNLTARAIPTGAPQRPLGWGGDGLGLTH
jgi:hypothetical protein